MIEKVILICSELWRLKRRHFSVHRDGSEEVFINDLAAFIAERHLVKAKQIEHLEKAVSVDVDNFVYIGTEINKQSFEQIQLLMRLNNMSKRRFKHVLNFILSEYFKENPELQEIEVPEFKYNKY